MHVGHRHMKAGQPLCTLSLLVCQPPEPRCTLAGPTSGHSMSGWVMRLGGLNDNCPELNFATEAWV